MCVVGCYLQQYFLAEHVNFLESWMVAWWTCNDDSIKPWLVFTLVTASYLLYGQESLIDRLVQLSARKWITVFPKMSTWLFVTHFLYNIISFESHSVIKRNQDQEKLKSQCPTVAYSEPWNSDSNVRHVLVTLSSSVHPKSSAVCPHT